MDKGRHATRRGSRGIYIYWKVVLNRLGDITRVGKGDDNMGRVGGGGGGGKEEEGRRRRRRRRRRRGGTVLGIIH